jgi:hypothetical protein
MQMHCILQAYLSNVTTAKTLQFSKIDNFHVVRVTDLEYWKVNNACIWRTKTRMWNTKININAKSKNYIKKIGKTFSAESIPLFSITESNSYFSFDCFSQLPFLLTGSVTFSIHNYYRSFFIKTMSQQQMAWSQSNLVLQKYNN